MPPLAKGAVRSAGGFVRDCANLLWSDLEAHLYADDRYPVGP
jgi:hypothetical protein